MLPEAAEPRKGVPQGRHGHALLTGGALAIAKMFPGIMEEMVERRRRPTSTSTPAIWYQAGGYRATSSSSAEGSAPAGRSSKA